MKSFLAWLVVLGVVGGGSGYFVKTYRDQSRAYAYRAAIADLKADFAKRAAGLPYLEADAYRGEVGVLLTDYFKRLDTITKQYPEQFDLERERKKMASDAAAGRLKEGQEQAKEERIALTLELFEKLRTGQYRPLHTVADKSFRFDVYELGRAKLSGEDRIKLAYVHWGAFGPVTYNLIEGTIRANFEKGKPVEIPKIVGEGQPPSLQVDPERWVMEFIPGVEIGYYDLPLFPKAATAVELNFQFTSQTVGGTAVPLSLKFGDIAVPDSWKTDGNWQAETQTVTAEEMQAAGAPVDVAKTK